MTGDNAHQDGATRPVPQRADFELSKREEGGWRLHIISNKGLHWAQTVNGNFSGAEHVLSLAAANAFLKEARHCGLKTEYIGPIGRSIL